MSTTLQSELPAEAPVVGPDVTLTSLSEEVSSRVLMDRAPRANCTWVQEH